MRVRLLITALAVAAPALTPAPVSAQEDVAQPTLVERYDFTRRLARFDLPGRLDEVSGLAFGPSGTLYGHGDERGEVFSIDPVTGTVGKGFNLGPTSLRDDFEAFAVAGDRLFIVSSGGHLYEFREAPQGGSSPVRISDIGLGASCEVEGMAFLSASGSLIVVCKNVRPSAKEVRFHRIPLDPSAPTPPPLIIPDESLDAVDLGKGIHPSGLDVDPATGHLVLVAAQEEVILEVGGDGRVISAHHFSGRRHPQAEGVAFGPDGLLYIADEANGGKARLTVYGPRTGGDGP